MRIRSFLALASACFFAAGFGIQACGGSSDDTAQVAQDSGVVEAAADAAEKNDAADAAPSCDPKTDFFAGIPDASIADGASTTGVCVGCVKASCATEVGKCAADCTCQNVAGTALDCFATSQAIVQCLGPLLSVPPATRVVGIALFGCVQSKCSDECAASALTDAGDGG